MEEEAEQNWFITDQMVYCAVKMCFVKLTFHVRVIALFEMELSREVTLSGAAIRWFACIKTINFAVIWPAKFIENCE